ncbi:hypothetical protein SEA_EURATIS_39 [Streptomyces phage Euratis]|uniref:Uncharacterized protein n=1 Tax=Streptomyces phage Euratis TaxID=2510569 RepID=A0A411B124_9CAUD|nr:hypothetical protein SEA_EURATIS_39 [Streptomyces phage Euratis]
MRVWRVGHRTALDNGFPSGPYTAKGLTEDDYDRLRGMGWSHSDERHPSPYSDSGLRGIDSSERCGFDSAEALNQWFDEWTEKLAASGFTVWEYEVPDWAVRVGKFGQVVFRADEAVEVSTHEFTYAQPALFA